MSLTEAQKKTLSRCSGEHLLLLRILTGSRLKKVIDEELDRRAGVCVRRLRQTARVRRAA
ncbi:MAG TPA: hypothetical protein PLL20_20300 [Phycisphaerae bacterium]|nr:hypothetical protein [Phycisphaerae bacterium]HRR86621.1 hypothetical protein [Phycisphaerae bacterium]